MAEAKKVSKEEFEKIVADQVKEAVAPILEKNKDEERKVLMDEVNKTIADELKKVEEKRLEVVKDELDKDPKAGFKSLSSFAKDVYLAGRGNTPSEALQKWHTKAAGTSHNISDGESGAYLIPDEWRMELFKPIMQEDHVFGRTRKVPLQRNTVNMPYVNGFDESSGKVYGAVNATWMDEEEQHSEKVMKFGTMQLSLKKLGLFAYVTTEMLEDSPMAMEPILRDSFRDAFTFEMNDKLLRGSGAGQPQGILNANSAVSVTGSGAASTILYEDVINMYRRSSDPGMAVWMANPDTMTQLTTMSIPVGTGGIPVFMPANGAAGRPNDTLFGRPLIWNKHCNSLGTVGDIIFVDWSQYYLAVKAGQEENGRLDTSIHLKFDYDQTAYRFIYRVDGQSAWKSAVTPPQSSDTMSPIVTLATRS